MPLLFCNSSNFNRFAEEITIFILRVHIAVKQSPAEAVRKRQHYLGLSRLHPGPAHTHIIICSKEVKYMGVIYTCDSDSLMSNGYKRRPWATAGQDAACMLFA